MLDRVLERIAADAEALACAEQLERCRAIIAEGTSADAQLRIFAQNEHKGAEIAIQRVARWIRDATLIA
jgi:carboxylate-amine ligase